MNIPQIYEVFKKSTGISTDTRNINKGQIFLALKGASFDGNQYADYALDQGASHVIVDDPKVVKDERYILVMDALHTLQKLANYHRNQFDIPVFSLTGTNGKTTTKELIVAVLEQKYKVSSTKGNFNNHIGVPLTLLDIDETAEIAVVEMGANKVGDIRELCSMGNPTVGLITNVGQAHLEGFGSFEGVVKTKTEIYDFLINNDKPLFYNDQEEILKENAQRSKKAIAFQSEDNKWEVDLKDQEGVTVQRGDVSIKTQLTGSYNAQNIAAAIALGEYFDVPMESIKKGLEGYVPTNNRSQVMKKGSNLLILDAYNANPTSMKAAIENLATKSGNKLAVLGDMFELGQYSEDAHKAVIDQLKKEGISAYLVGEEFSKKKDTDQSQSYFKTTEDLKVFLEDNKIENATVLVKGSRGIALEKVLEVL